MLLLLLCMLLLQLEALSGMLQRSSDSATACSNLAIGFGAGCCLQPLQKSEGCLPAAACSAMWTFTASDAAFLGGICKTAMDSNYAACLHNSRARTCSLIPRLQFLSTHLMAGPSSNL